MDAATRRSLLAGGWALALLGLVACIAWGSRRAEGDPAPIHVVFRYDDYGQRAQESANEGVLETFRDRGVPLTVAVIPCPSDVWTPASEEPCRESMDDSRVRTLVSARREGVAEIALHGFQHVDAGHRAFQSEFAGVDPEEQRARIGKGLDEVQRVTGVRPVTFVPPFDAYDAATLRAVDALGMEAFSGWLAGPPSAGEDLAFLPNTVHVRRVREAVERLYAAPDPGAVLVTIFHPWDLVEADRMAMLDGGTRKPLDLSRLDSLLEWLLARPAVRITTMEALAAGDADVSEARFAAAQRHARSKAWRLLPPPFAGSPHLVLHSRERYRHLAVDAVLRVATWSLFVLVGVAWAVSEGLEGARRRLGAPAALAGVGLVGGLLVLAVGPFAMGPLGWKDFAVLLAAGGAALGSALALAPAGRGARELATAPGGSG